MSYLASILLAIVLTILFAQFYQAKLSPYPYKWSPYPSTPLFQIEAPSITQYQLISKTNSSKLYHINTKTAYTQYPLQLFIINAASHYEVGYQYGLQLGSQIYENYFTFLKTVFPNALEREAIILFLEYQWRFFLSKQIPNEIFEELKGIRDGGIAAGYNNLDQFVTFIITLANFPGDVEQNISWLLLDEEHITTISQNPEALQLFQKLKQQITVLTSAMKHYKGMGCSFFAIWGSRTDENGQLYSCRNLDWAPNTGLHHHKLITWYNIQGKIPYVTVGYSGVIGSLAGMNFAGLSVHETGNDVKNVTFLGQAWTIRLRMILEQANSLSSALDMWNKSNNTMGMNHMIASGVEKKAVALETMRRYTALFYDNDSRETQLTGFDSETQKEYVLGSPLSDALWRTNHGYDPLITSSQIKHMKPLSDSTQRYFIIQNAFTSVSQTTEYQAVNVTSLLSDKGTNWFTCAHTDGGVGVLSVAFVPAVKRMYVAFEDTVQQKWIPAGCSTYLYMDFTVLQQLK